MSQQLPGTVKILVKIPRTKWQKLQCFRGASDADKVNLILDKAFENLERAFEERKAEVIAEREAAKKKPGIFARVFGGKD